MCPTQPKFKDDLESDLKRIKNQIGDLKIDVVPQISKAASNKVKTQMNQLRQELSGKNVNLQPKLGSTANVSAGIALLTRDRKVMIQPDLDQKALAGVLSGLLALSGGRVGLDALAEGMERLTNLDRLVPTISIAAVKTVALGAAALAATGHALSLSSSIASIGYAGLALPGILGGVVIGLGVTAAALKDFNEVFPEMQERLSALQDQLSANFWAEAEAPIRNMIDNLWPAFAAGIRDTATAVGGFFGSLASELQGMDLSPMFDQLVKSVEIFTGYTDNIANVIEKLGLAGSAYLPNLATWFGDLIAKFDAWLGVGAKLDALIAMGITNLMALGSVLASTWDIFAGFAAAATAAGGLGLVGLADVMQRIADVVNSPGFQKGMTSVFTAAYEAMSNLTSAAGPGVEAMLLSIRDLFVQIAPQVGAALGGLIGSIGTALANPAVSEGIVTMFEGITNAMGMMSTAAGPMATILASIAPIVGALAENIAMVLTNGLDRMAPTFAGIAEAILPVIDILGTVLNKALTDLTPLWQVMGENVQKVIEKLGPFIQALGDLWNLLAPVLIPVLKLVASIVGDAIAGAINGATNVIQGFVGFIQGFIDFFKSVFTGDWKGAWKAIKDIVSSIWEVIIGVIEIAFNIGILGLVRKGWSAIKGIFESAGGTLKTVAGEIWDSIKSRASTMWDQIQVMPSIALQAIIKFLKGIVGDMKAGAELVWEAIKTAAETQLKLLMTLFTELPGKIKGALAGAATMLTDTGKAIIQGLLDGIQAMWGAVESKLNALTDKLPDWKGPMPVDKVLLQPAGEAIIGGLIKGLESRYSDVRSSLNGLTSDIASSMSSGSDYRLGVAASLDTSGVNMSALGGLSATVGNSVASAPVAAPSEGNVQIDNITIPLDDLRQLKSLEEFLDMLRVRTRQGVDLMAKPNDADHYGNVFQ